jgi:hypothetical protein
LYEWAGVRPSQIVRQAVHVWRFGLPEYPREAFERDQRSLHALRQEINNWNLVNGMYFSRWQIERLVYFAELAERLRFARHHAEPKYRIDPPTFSAAVVRLELAAESVLRPGQLDVLRDYKPCLIPPKNLKDPVRVGQAGDTGRLAQWLERARGKNDNHVARMIGRLIECEVKHRGPMGESEKVERRQLLTEAARTAAGMSDVEFALSKDELAETIQLPNRKDELIAEIDVMRRQRLKPGRTSKFLLNEGFARVLMTRYGQLARGSSATVKAGAYKPEVTR